MWIKICGNTNLNDCLLAAELGANALGFVFAHSKRNITADRVSAIASQLPQQIERIGVFTSNDADLILRTAEQARLTGVQLHGGLDFALLECMRSHFGDASGRCSVVQVLPWWSDFTAEEQRNAFTTDAEAIARDGSADAMLIDSRTRRISGGTGITFDWAAAREALERVRYRIVVAGGLNPGNVACAIRELDPWGVDVASGVESSPGRKDPARLAAFLGNARSAAPKNNGGLSL